MARTHVQEALRLEEAEQRIIERARVDPAVFCRYVLRSEKTNKPIQFDKGHHELLEALQTHKRLVICASPRLGKTTLGTYGLHLWHIGRDPVGYRSQIGSALKTTAEKHMSVIRSMVENRIDGDGRPSRLVRVFPELDKPPSLSNQEYLVLDRGERALKAPTVEAIGDMARKQGLHVLHQWYDDMVDPVISQSRYLCRKQADWVMDNESRVDPDGARFFIQNTFTRFDTGHLLAEEHGWHLHLMPCVDKHKRTLYPAVWPQGDVDKYSKSRFDQDMHCIPRREGDSDFQESFIDLCRRLGHGLTLVSQIDTSKLPDTVRVITGVDMSHRKKKTSDDTVFFTILVGPPSVLGLEPTTPGKHAFRVVWIQRGKMGPPEIRANLIDHWHRFGSYFKVEDNGGQNYLRELLGLDYPEIPISPFTTTASTKSSPEIGIKTLAGEMSAGRWIIPSMRDAGGVLRSEAAIEEWLNELRIYDPQSHTPDGLMAAWMARLGARSMFEHRVDMAGEQLTLEEMMAVGGYTREEALQFYPHLATDEDEVEMPDLGALKARPEAVKNLPYGEVANVVAERICIAGGPRTGKTTMAKRLNPMARSTDDLNATMDWSDQSAEVATWFDNPGPWVVEGVTVARALRKWLVNNPHGKPCDRVIWLESPKVQLTPKQDTMRKGVVTVWTEILTDIVSRGVEVGTGLKPTDLAREDDEVGDIESLSAPVTLTKPQKVKRTSAEAYTAKVERANAAMLKKHVMGSVEREIDEETSDYMKTWYG